MIGLGYLATRCGIFDDQDSKRFVRLVLTFMLPPPLHVFGGLWSNLRRILIANVPLIGWLMLSMTGCYFIMILIYRFGLHNSRQLATLRAMSVANPSVPFIGSAVLPLLFSTSNSAITIGICSLTVNIIMLLIAFDALSSDRSPWKRLAATFKKPLVIAAILGFLLTLGGSKMPTQLTSTFDLLGKGASGVAIFAAGIVLGTRHLSFDKTILTTVMMKNIVFPLVVLLIMMAVGVSHDLIRLVVIALAIPTATMPSTLAIQFNVNEKELASTQFWSTACSLITLSAFVLALA
ncbi:AEC family transporter [Limosilactobacillus mucosae]|uniref:AEC family transporter n=1 Tax=Limosilactobacillus mucosae TaxID=97478 RepID=UPI002FEE0DCC